VAGHLFKWNFLPKFSNEIVIINKNNTHWARVQVIATVACPKLLKNGNSFQLNGEIGIISIKSAVVHKEERGFSNIESRSSKNERKRNTRDK
jgi:hypothetical protein